MDWSKNHKYALIVCLAVGMAVFFTNVSAVIRHWESFTSFNEVTDMTLYKGDVWVASKGGLVRIDTDLMSFETYTNIDGLGTNQIFALCVDSKNRLWAGGKGRLINFSDPGNPDGYLFTDRDDLMVEIYDIASVPSGDSLWLANRLGLTVFLAPDEIGDGLILDTYNRLGSIERDTPAKRVALDSDSVWVGTEKGLAAGERFDIRQLKAPTGWKSYQPSSIGGLPNDDINGLVIMDDTVYIGTSVGVFRFERDGDTSLIDFNPFGPRFVYNMSLIGDSLLTNSNLGSSIYYEGVTTRKPTAGMPIANSTAGIVDGNAEYWNGNLLHGIFFIDGSTMIPFDVGGTPGNNCHDVAATQGKIWGAFAFDGLACLENGVWTDLEISHSEILSLEVGPLGELWVGTFGSGAFRILGDSIAHFNVDNSALSGTIEFKSYVVIPDIASSGDAVWFANFQGWQGELVAVNPFDLSQWVRYPVAAGDGSDLMVTVAVGQGVVYAGSENSGIHAVMYNETPFYLNDDFGWEFNRANSGIGSDIIRHIEIDEYDSMWVGTAFGMSYQSLGEIIFDNIALPDGFGPSVASIDFDGQGSLYAGSGRGLAIRDIAAGIFDHLTTKNSGLVDNDIRGVYYDHGGNAIWLATRGGISRLTMPYALAAQDVDQVLAYPNPFIIRYGHERVRFNYAGIGRVRIYSLAGELVRDIPIIGEWDGRNENSEEVAAGVYFFTVADREDEVGRGKILLIRE